MRNLIRRALLRGNDRGAVGVLVGVLVGGGVLLGMGALVIDVGEMYVERAQLQNGADAAALAVAKSCALGECDESQATTYANRNAGRDQLSEVADICAADAAGSALLGSPACSSGASMTDCPEPPEGTSYVDVHTSTLDEADTLLPVRFSRTLVGNEDYPGKTVRACARAAWGAPKTADGLALTISWCEWDEATSGGEDYAPPPPEVPDESYERVLRFHAGAASNPDGSSQCTAEPSGADIPGGFGWTVPEEGNCSTDFNYDEASGDTTYDAAPGNTVADDPNCIAALLSAWTTREPVIIPIYDGTPAGGGANGQYDLHQPSAFVITGYYLGGQVKKPSWLPGPLYNSFPCTGSARCISGYFTTAVTSGTPGSGPGSGVTAVRLTG